MSDRIIILNETSFDEEVKSSEEPVLVDFWADWCRPCHAIAPALSEIADEKAGVLKVAKINVDDAPAIASRFDVMTIPTLLLFKDGTPVVRIVGAKSKQALLGEVQPHLG